MSDNSARILIVDDNEMNRDILSRQLRRSGKEADSADHGRTALQMLESTDYDLVLLDLMMPDIDGLEVLRRIRKSKALTELPVILVSANDQSEKMVEAFKCGANDYVLKPIDFPVILARINMHLSQLRAARQAKAVLDEHRVKLPRNSVAEPKRQRVAEPVSNLAGDPVAGPTVQAHADASTQAEALLESGSPTDDQGHQRNELAEHTMAIDGKSQVLGPIRIDEELPAGTSFGNYEVVGTLGKGAMGVVYEARNSLLDEHVALKVLPPSIQVDRDAVARFRLEARSAAKVEHPNVVPIYDVGHWANIYFIAMELIRGSNVSELIKSDGAMDWREATRIIADVLRGLAAAHKRGLIHRDIKPSNILLDESGVVKVTDFGLVKLIMSATDETSLTRTGGIMGTPLYMSPEQIKDEPVDVQSDIYSVGATYFACLTGRSPFPGTGIDVLWAHCSKEIPDPRQLVSDLPEACTQITMRALAKAPKDRFESADQMLQSLESLLN